MPCFKAKQPQIFKLKSPWRKKKEEKKVLECISPVVQLVSLLMFTYRLKLMDCELVQTACSGNRAHERRDNPSIGPIKAWHFHATGPSCLFRAASSSITQPAKFAMCVLKVNRGGYCRLWMTKINMERVQGFWVSLRLLYRWMSLLTKFRQRTWRRWDTLTGERWQLWVTNVILWLCPTAVLKGCTAIPIVRSLIFMPDSSEVIKKNF